MPREGGESWCRHTSRFMMIWLTFLPLALYSSCGWAIVPAVGIMAFLLLGIEEIGVSVEEPFSILALGTTSSLGGAPSAYGHACLRSIKKTEVGVCSDQRFDVDGACLHPSHPIFSPSFSFLSFPSEFLSSASPSYPRRPFSMISLSLFILSVFRTLVCSTPLMQSLCPGELHISS